MRNFKFLLIAVFGMLSLQSHAAGISNLKITSFESEKEIQLSFHIVGKGSVKITMWNNQNELIIENRFQSVDVFKERISLKNLDKGIYRLEIEDELLITKYPVIVGSHSISLNTSAGDKQYKAMLKFDAENDFVDVNWLMQDFCKAQIIILDRRGNRVFSIGYNNLVALNKRVRLDGLKRGQYKLVVENKRDSYEKDFKIK